MANNYLEDNFPWYDCDENGTVYKNGVPIKPFNSNGYQQVLLFDQDHNRRVTGVHVVVAMKYLDYFPGCNVHHKDENKHNNCVNNLQVMTSKEHARLHISMYNPLAEYARTHPPVNKGKKMSKEFCEKCSISAKKRVERQRREKANATMFLVW